MEQSWKNLPPREKLAQKGAASLSDTELLAIFLRTGTRGENVLALAERLIARFGSLYRLMNASEQEMCAVYGIGLAKYAQLNAVAELARRYFTCREALQREAITGSEQMLTYLYSALAHREREIFQVIFLDNQHRVLDSCEMFRGTINSVEVHPREVVRAAMKRNSPALVLAHNHPSGTAEPSAADRYITRKIILACQLMEIRVLDHIVIGHGEHVSFAERGWMSPDAL